MTGPVPKVSALPGRVGSLFRRRAVYRTLRGRYVQMGIHPGNPPERVGLASGVVMKG